MILFSVLPPLTFIVMWLIERRWPARKFPEVKNWPHITLAFFLLTGILSTLIPLTLSPIVGLRVFNLSTLPVPAQVLLGWLQLSLIVFTWHVLRHEIIAIWRYSHQLHHSVPRLDVAVSVYFHPIESCSFSIISVTVCSVFLGLSPLAAACVGYVQCFNGMFQHWNVSTPRWVGYVMQRPESHCLHHAMGRSGCNYSDFPLWDMLYGTFRNPAEFHGRVGFARDVAMDWGRMFRGIDLSGNLPQYVRPGSAPRQWAKSSLSMDRGAQQPPH